MEEDLDRLKRMLDALSEEDRVRLVPILIDTLEFFAAALPDEGATVSRSMSRTIGISRSVGWSGSYSTTK